MPGELEATGAGAGANGPGTRSTRATRRGIAVAFAAYQAIALPLWWHALARGLPVGTTTVLPAGSADPAQEVWFLAWVPHALGAGIDPFFTHAVFAPAGVNLLSNTSVELIGLLLSPITVTAGPAASFWAAALLAPALSALGAFALIRRLVERQGAAFAGGLCYGFGPFLTTDLRYGHFNLTWLVLPPLIFLALHELLVRRRRRPAAVGAVLGLLVVAQFFISTEMLAVTAITAAIAVAAAAIAWPRATWAARGAAGRGVGVALAISVAALGYPVWFAADGPRHFSGPVWHHIGQIAATLASAVQPHTQLIGVAFISGGNGAYLGAGLLAVLAAGLAVLWRSAPLRLALGLAAITFVLSLGYQLHVGTATSTGIPLPAAVLSHVPQLDSIAPERFAAMTDLFCGIALGVVVDHAARWQRPARPRAVARRLPARALPLGRSARMALATAIAAAALVPMAITAPWPYATAVFHEPAAVRTPPVAGTGHPRVATAHPRVALYPDGPDEAAVQMLWQAQGSFSFPLAGGYAITPGRHGHAVVSPQTGALWLVFAAATLHRLHLPLRAATRAAVRADVAALGGETVVVLPGAPGSRVLRRALSSALGPPASAGGAALWPVRHPSPIAATRAGRA